MDIRKIPACSKDGNVYVVVEIPKGGRNKYEYDKDLGVIALDRTLYSAVYYPTDYGFVPCTRGADGELLDMMVMTEEPVFPGCLVESRLIGVLTITHSSGLPEQKLLGVPINEPLFKDHNNISDVRPHFLKEIEHFFDVFKDLEGSDVGVLGWEDAARAQRVLDQAIRDYEAYGESR